MYKNYNYIYAHINCPFFVLVSVMLQESDRLCVCLMVYDFVCQVVRGVSGGARSLGEASIGGVFHHADGGARPAGAGPSELSPAV